MELGGGDGGDGGGDDVYHVGVDHILVDVGILVQ